MWGADSRAATPLFTTEAQPLCPGSRLSDPDPMDRSQQHNLPVRGANENNQQLHRTH